jgi:hypothetical protein
MGHHSYSAVPYSCPMIDATIDHLDMVTQLYGLEEDSELQYHIMEAKEKLEEVRTVNHTLREKGCEDARQRAALEAEVSCLQDVIERKQCVIDEWELNNVCY